MVLGFFSSDKTSSPNYPELSSAIGNAIGGSNSNTIAVGTLDTSFAGPDAESLWQACNALVRGLRRP